MFYEYAMEPSVISTWERARYFLGAFGPWKGRFLAQYPRRWKRMVYEGLACADIEKKRIEERLAALDGRVFSRRSSAEYDGTVPWIDNAMVEHRRVPFRAILAEGGTGGGVVHPDEVDEQCELWRVETGHLVPRAAAAFVAMVDLLLRASTRVVLVDPYFRADQNDKAQPLVAFCRAIEGQGKDVEVHFSDEPRGYDPCMRDAQRALPRLLPPGTAVTLRCWKHRTGGPRLHNRYLLTDIGGVKFGDGIELGDPGHEDHLSILDEPSRARLWDQYTGPAPAFDEAGAPQTFVGRTGGRR
ncbi:MAG: hypothetical protein OEZ06_11790 [Myxococcales bacterium]|nr:hypothetical protein [Myxococcales bacterium]